MQQAFKYKAHLFELHIPILGFSNILNPNFIKPFNALCIYKTVKNPNLISFIINPLMKLKILNSENSKNILLKIPIRKR